VRVKIAAFMAAESSAASSPTRQRELRAWSCAGIRRRIVVVAFIVASS
jgi:hypothetical protein